jgi:hypothetical protein
VVCGSTLNDVPALMEVYTDAAQYVNLKVLSCQTDPDIFPVSTVQPVVRCVRFDQTPTPTHLSMKRDSIQAYKML